MMDEFKPIVWTNGRIKRRRKCKRCGFPIYNRSHQALYCIECTKPNKRRMI
jgi:ribosomal protein L37E